ncbi:hypothetical protein C8R44DRAFT_984923 [Mycena epipterygia]|nr:hypothetical protein C8R44DRAFT_984923 [Mycena epipterygia]
MAPRKAFAGLARKLVLGIDIGTTYAGISYCLLEPGKIPTILPVTRFPAQDHVGGDSKVPSAIYYDQSGRPRALGAETLPESIVEQALPTIRMREDEFHRVFERNPQRTAARVMLPDILFGALKQPSSSEQQSNMRKAAIIAGLVPNTSDGRERIHFVTEGEASLHFCITNGLATDPLRLGKGVVIVDAGGGTIDISAYRKLKTLKGESFEEIAPPQCLFKGSIFVSDRAREHLQGSKYADDVKHIADCFDKTTKLRFRSTDEWSYIRFGRPRDKDEALNISKGQLKLSSAVVAGFFKPSLEAIVSAIENQVNTALVPISSVLLVGGFGASEWLYTELKKRMKLLGLELSRPDSHVNKAVADGAVSFYLDHFVSARISKHTDGVKCSVVYEANNAEHCSRSRSIERDADGRLRVPKRFSAILKKNIRVFETREFRKSYVRLSKDLVGLRTVQLPIWRYLGQDEDPMWADIDPDRYSVLCTVRADTSQIAQSLKRQTGSLGLYYCLEIDIVLSFGLTELKAQIAWTENGIEKRGPAELAY